jgi:hypothetical protein
LLKAKVHAADILDNRGGKILLENLNKEFPESRFAGQIWVIEEIFQPGAKVSKLDNFNRQTSEQMGTLSGRSSAAGNVAIYSSQTAMGCRENNCMDWAKSKNEQRL